MNMGVGRRFLPTEEELMAFLKNRTMGIPPPPVVVEKNLYGVDSTPWKLLDDNAGWGLALDSCTGKVSPNAGVIYVISELSHVRNGGKNWNRTAGCGTWHGSAKAKLVENSMGQEIGKMRALKFVSKTEMKGHWIMHEYALSGVLLGPGTSTHYVICRITRKDDDFLARFEGCGKRKAVLGGGAGEENQEAAAGSDDCQESQHSSKKKSKMCDSTKEEDGDWLMEMLNFEDIEVDQQNKNLEFAQEYQNGGGEWVEEVAQNCQNGGEVDGSYQNLGMEIGTGAFDQQEERKNLEPVEEVHQIFQNEGGESGAGVSDQQRHNFEWKGKMRGDFGLKTAWEEFLFADEEDYSGSHQFPAQVVENYLVSCIA